MTEETFEACIAHNQLETIVYPEIDITNHKSLVGKRFIQSFGLQESKFGTQYKVVQVVTIKGDVFLETKERGSYLVSLEQAKWIHEVTGIDKRAKEVNEPFDWEDYFPLFTLIICICTIINIYCLFN